MEGDGRSRDGARGDLRHIAKNPKVAKAAKLRWVGSVGGRMFKSAASLVLEPMVQDLLTSSRPEPFNLVTYWQ